LPGEHADGNDFLDAALMSGAAAAIASRPVTEALKGLARERGAALMEVATGQGVRALQELASGYRNTLGATVIGITGSSGKTTTKDLVEAVLASGLATYATPGNYNNEIGAPATVLEASETTRALVVEMGMQARGEIARLCEIARPSVGIITNVGVAHCELLGSRENIARAKAELVCSLPEHTGIAILNGDDPYTPFVREEAAVEEREVKVLLYGLGAHNDIRGAHIEYDADGRPSFDLWLPDGQPRRVRLSLQGEHNVYNALAAAACGHVCGIAPQSTVKALASVRPAAMRQETRDVGSGVTVINDTYNANPDSMRAALALLGRFECGRMHVAVLGDMFELGEEEERFHREVGSFAHVTHVDLLVTVGALAAQIAAGARAVGMPVERVIECASCEEALAALSPCLSRQPVILVKASRGMQLEAVAEGIAALC
jgi:UDP-N-acetylmuramoyl-tripeptide--D-alanyl-D-alanine ligase